MRHKNFDVVVAFMSGEEIEFRVVPRGAPPRGLWTRYDPTIHISPLEEGDKSSIYEWRIKPNLPTFRLAVFRDDCHPEIRVCNFVTAEHAMSQHPNFVRWLGLRIPYEVNP